MYFYFFFLKKLLHFHAAAFYNINGHLENVTAPVDLFTETFTLLPGFFLMLDGLTFAIVKSDPILSHFEVFIVASVETATEALLVVSVSASAAHSAYAARIFAASAA